MNGIKIRIQDLLKKEKIRRGLLTGLWVVLVVTIIVPLWQGVLLRNVEIQDLEARLATLDDWTVAGMWLAPGVQERTLPVNGAFSRLFPLDRGREEFFLSLGRVADQSGVENFSLSESSSLGMFENDVWGDGTAMASEGGAPPTDAATMEMAGAPAMNIPKVELSPYRVKAEFSGDYQRIAYFMSGLKNIDRALKVHSLAINPEKDGVQVKLELDVYVSKTNQS